MFKSHSPIEDAIMYFTQIVNDISVRQQAERMCANRPAIADKLMQIYESSLKLERAIDEKLSGLIMRSSRYDHFFIIELCGKEDELPIATVAKLLLGHSAALDDDTEGLDSLCASRKALPRPQKIRLFLDGISNMKKIISFMDGIDIDTVSDDGFLNFLSTLPIPTSLIRKLTELYVNYESSIDELAELLRPATAIIEDNEALYGDAIQRLETIFAGIGDLPGYMRGRFNCDVPIADTYSVRFSAIDPNSICMRDSMAFGTVELTIGIGIHDITEQLYGSYDSRRISGCFKALSDETRIDMLQCVCSRPVCGLELGDIFSMPPSTVSYHINKLVMSGFVQNTVKNGKVYYQPNFEKIDEFIELFRRFLKTPYIPRNKD